MGLGYIAGILKVTPPRWRVLCFVPTFSRSLRTPPAAQSMTQAGPWPPYMLPEFGIVTTAVKSISGHKVIGVHARM